MVPCTTVSGGIKTDAVTAKIERAENKFKISKRDVGYRQFRMNGDLMHMTTKT